jgi:hypothetical protein
LLVEMYGSSSEVEPKILFLKEVEKLNKTVKILYIDQDFRVTYFNNHDGVLISSPISQEDAIILLMSLLQNF